MCVETKRVHVGIYSILARDSYKSITCTYPPISTENEKGIKTLSTVTIESLMHRDPDKTMGTNKFNDRREAEPHSNTEESWTVAGLCQICEAPLIGVKASNMDSGQKARPASKSNKGVMQSLD